MLQWQKSVCTKSYFICERLDLMMHYLLALFFLIVSYQMPNQAHDIPLFPDTASLDSWIENAKKSIVKKTLPNGITVLFYPLTHTSVVDIRVTVGIGSRHEHDGQFGLAHMVEHMIFKGTDARSEVDLKLIAEKFGDAEWNASTSMDQTSYYFKTDNKNWPIFLSMLADSMSNARFDENHFASEVKTVISELNLNRANPGRKMFEAILLNSFGLGHPYHHSPIGIREDLVNASAQDLKDFYTMHYTPGRTVLTIVGNIDPNDLYEKIDCYFGHISITENPSVLPAYDHQAFLPTDFIQHNTILHTQIKNPSSLVYWITPGARDLGAITADAVCHLLNERLKKIATSCDLAYSCQAFPIQFFDAGVFAVSYEPKVISKQIRTLIDNEIHDLTYSGPTDEEMTRLKVIERNDFADGFESTDFITKVLKSYCLNNNEYESFDRFNAVQNLSKSDVKTFCKTYLAPNLSSIISCLPLQEKEKAGWTGMQQKIDAYENMLLAQKQRETQLDEQKLLSQLPEPESLDVNFPSPDIEATLSNGLKIYIKQRTHAPNITLLCGFYNPTLMKIYHGLKHQSKIPLLAMALLDEESEGTKQHPEPLSKTEHTQFFDTLGASYTLSAQGAALRCLTQDFETASTRLLHILTHPTYPEEAFRRTISNRIQRILMNQTDARYRAYKCLDQHLYQSYPWKQSDEQAMQELSKLTPHDLHNFHKKFINPQSMFLTLVGNIDASQVIQQLERIFGSWQAEQSYGVNDLKALIIPEIENPPAQDIALELAKEHITLIAGRITTTKDTDDARALLILEGYLNRMLFNIRERTGLFYTCHANLAPSSSVTQGNASINTSIALDNLQQTKDEIKAVLRDVAEHGISQEYLTIAKQNYTAMIAKAFATNRALLTYYGRLIAQGKPFSYLYSRLEDINNLTLEQVNATAKKYCNPKTWTFIQAGRIEHNVTP